MDLFDAIKILLALLLLAVLLYICGRGAQDL